MNDSPRKIATLTIACALLILTTSNLANAAEEDYIGGLSISMLNPPDSVATGETFTVKVRVANNSGSTVSACLCPPPAEGFEWVPINEGGWVPNERYVTINSGETKTYEFTLTVREDVQFASGSTAQARLRARIRELEANVVVAPDDTKEVVIRHETETWSIELPLILKIIIAFAGIAAVIGAVKMSGGEEVPVEPSPGY
ncbi:hypothetical protein AKJ35_00350 [candidate division MSBL1 archaeon SCGC-AAA833F18]|uniref:Uncharacterized protein n=2 Tax=candidate division MSBL1 TaxID=215777 RepID=A0A133VT33_9EURY|nr:hypothetical protein AKJ48_01540 [candidate division MSBL1 archaeon SCGC-AAA261O19]KXB09596.1 hypothetical protein AKJ35_00350 [candidate division MSBL1 archaeon SCGC-AAA833F18]